MNKKILVTGGAGYIGGHTIVDLLANGFEVVSVDNLSRGNKRMLQGIEKITGKPIKNYKVDLTNLEDVEAIFMEEDDIVGIIHFAAYKSVPESVAEPLMYYQNNIQSLVNILTCAQDCNIFNFVFSSSCSVYGNVTELPVKEATALGNAESPYARTKQMGEAICQDMARAWEEGSFALLRYFNPVGAHPSGHIGELQEKPENLVPVITQTAIGKREQMDVFGSDWATRDGSGIRDYIHVMDIAHAHTLALKRMLDGDNVDNCEIFNLGSGNGVTVLELINAFERVSGQKLNYKVGGRRTGDVEAVYADNAMARKVLGWNPQHDLDAMMATAWEWEKVMKGETAAKASV